MKILIFDPSGNYFEGKGTSGWALYHEDKLISLGQISSKLFKSRYEYWKEHINLIKALSPNFVIIENYVLYSHTRDAQVGSEFETPQLIGVLKYYCEDHNISYYLQHARIKRRFTNEILLRKGIISQKTPNSRYYAIGIPLSEHILDAIRHGEFFINFKLKKILEEK